MKMEISNIYIYDLYDYEVLEYYEIGDTFINQRQEIITIIENYRTLMV